MLITGLDNLPIAKKASLKLESKRSQLVKDLNGLLQEYVRYRNLNALERYVQESGNVNVLIPGFSTHTTLLCEASRYYDICAFNTLFACRDCDLNFPDANGCTPLHHATRGRRSGSVSYLLKHGANPDVPNKRGIFPLVVALDSFLHQCVALMLEYGASPNVPVRRHCSQRKLPPYIGDTISPLLYVLVTSPSPLCMGACLIYAGARAENLPEETVYSLLSSRLNSADTLAFVRLLIASGFNVRSERWVKEARSAENAGLEITDDKQELVKLVESSWKQPAGLQSLCRGVVRRTIVASKSGRSHLKRKLDSLPVPKSVVSFLKLRG